MKYKEQILLDGEELSYLVVKMLTSFVPALRIVSILSFIYLVTLVAKSI